MQHLICLMVKSIFILVWNLMFAGWNPPSPHSNDPMSWRFPITPTRIATFPLGKSASIHWPCDFHLENQGYSGCGSPMISTSRTQISHGRLPGWTASGGDLRRFPCREGRLDPAGWGGKTWEMGVWVGDTSQLWVGFWDWQVGEINVD